MQPKEPTWASNFDSAGTITRWVEDFIASGYRALSGITIDAHNLERQAGVIEATHDAAVPVTVELLLDRLANPGFDYGPLPYLPVYGVNPDQLYGDAAVRRQMIEKAVELQLDNDCSLVAPHVFTENALHDDLTVTMAAEAVQLAAGRPVRAIVAANRDRLSAAGGGAAHQLAEGLAGAGASSVELRLSPTGDKDMSVLKIRSIFAIVESFRDYFGHVTLGAQGAIGPSAIALGVAEGFSVGIGMREQYNYTSLKKAQPQGDDDHNYGPQAGVYLPSAGATVTRRMAQGLFADTTIRHRLRCQFSCCTNSIEGPASDPRRHYLHSRTEQLTRLMDRPAPWRARMEQQRLEQAVDTIDIINDGHIPPKCHPIKTRTIRSLIAELDVDSGMSSQSDTG